MPHFNVYQQRINNHNVFILKLKINNIYHSYWQRANRFWNEKCIASVWLQPGSRPLTICFCFQLLFPTFAAEPQLLFEFYLVSWWMMGYAIIKVAVVSIILQKKNYITECFGQSNTHTWPIPLTISLFDSQEHHHRADEKHSSDDAGCYHVHLLLQREREQAYRIHLSTLHNCHPPVYSEPFLDL